MNYQEALPPVLVVEAEPRYLHSQPEAGNEQAENLNDSLFQRTLAMSQGIDFLAKVAPATAALATLTTSQPAEGITPSLKTNLVYALGTLGYTFRAVRYVKSKVKAVVNTI